MFALQDLGLKVRDKLKPELPSRNHPSQFSILWSMLAIVEATVASYHSCFMVLGRRETQAILFDRDC